MSKDTIEEILSQLLDHENRISKLEGILPSNLPMGDNKQRTLRELIKGRKLNNGQEQLSVIVGYFEMVIKKPVHKNALKSEWISAKMLNKYDASFLARAKNVFFTVDSSDQCILTQTGEEFFEKFINNEPIKKTS